MNHTELSIDDPSLRGMRVDRYVAEVAKLFSRSQLKSRKVELSINGAGGKWSHRLSPGDLVALSWEPEPESRIVPEAMELNILFENEDVVVVNKPQGMVVHPAAGNSTGTLVQGLAYLEELDEEELLASNQRPGIVHRLDKDTSGVIITAKNPEARQFLANQFAKRHTRKDYLAIVKGMVFPRSGRIDAPIRRDPKNRKRFAVGDGEGKAATTDYRVLKQWEGYAFVALHPETGRTHQLRVHLASIGHPVLGDPIYARRDSRYPEATLMLHARRLQILLPRRVPDRERPSGYHYEGGETVEFQAPLPERFKLSIQALAQQALSADA